MLLIYKTGFHKSKAVCKNLVKMNGESMSAFPLSSPLPYSLPCFVKVNESYPLIARGNIFILICVNKHWVDSVNQKFTLILPYTSLLLGDNNTI